MAVDESTHSLQQLLLQCHRLLIAASHCCILNSFIFSAGQLLHCHWLISLMIYDVITPSLAAQQQQHHCCAAHFLRALHCCAHVLDSAVDKPTCSWQQLLLQYHHPLIVASSDNLQFYLVGFCITAGWFLKKLGCHCSIASCAATVMPLLHHNVSFHENMLASAVSTIDCLMNPIFSNSICYCTVAAH